MDRRSERFSNHRTFVQGQCIQCVTRIHIVRIYIVKRLYHIHRRLKDGQKSWLCLGLFSKRRSSSLPSANHPTFSVSNQNQKKRRDRRPTWPTTEVYPWQNVEIRYRMSKRWYTKICFWWSIAVSPDSHTSQNCRILLVQQIANLKIQLPLRDRHIVMLQRNYQHNFTSIAYTIPLAYLHKIRHLPVFVRVLSTWTTTCTKLIAHTLQSVNAANNCPFSSPLSERSRNKKSSPLQYNRESASPAELLDPLHQLLLSSSSHEKPFVVFNYTTMSLLWLFLFPNVEMRSTLFFCLAPEECKCCALIKTSSLLSSSSTYQSCQIAILKVWQAAYVGTHDWSCSWLILEVQQRLVLDWFWKCNNDWF
jgi:hypothetical protein